MRLLSRNAPVEEMTTSPPDSRQLEPARVPLKAQKLLGEKGRLGFDIEESIIISGDEARASGGIVVPPKAQKLLGEKGRVRNNRSQDAAHTDPESLWRVRDAEKRSMAHMDRASEADSDTVPGAKKGTALPFVPVALRSSDDLLHSSNGSTVPTGTSSYYPGHQPSIESLNREHYDASKAPLHVSQQTSESSVRDMALRKGARVVHDDPKDGKLATPPSSSAGKRQPPGERTNSDGPRTQKKAGLRSFFPHGKSAARAASASTAPARSAPDPTDAFDSLPEGTIHMQVKRHGSQLLTEPVKRPDPPSTRPSAKSGERVKIFEPDIFDSKKTNVYRPPKGIKNWFDGFDISSDEEESEPVELPAVEKSGKGSTTAQQALPSVFSLYGPPARDFTPPAHETRDDSTKHSSPVGPAATSVGRDRMGSKGSQRSLADESASSGAMDNRKRSGESRLAKSRLGAESVLSLSSGSEDEHRTASANRDSIGHSTIVEGKTSLSMELQRPKTHPRKSDSHRRSASDTKVRRANSYNTSTPSNPFRDSQNNDTSTPRVPSWSNGSPRSASSSVLRRNLSALLESPQYRPPTHTSYDRDGLESTGDETSSSVPTDASRLMAVTEEEMMLLELMRQKRAAMQKLSFAQGYRLARRHDEGHHHHHHSSNSEDMRMNPELMVLKKKVGDRTNSRGHSRTESLIREELEQRKRMSALRKEDVDKAFKMGRFFETDGGSGDRNSKMDRFLVMAPGIANDLTGRPISGTEIELDSVYSDNEGVQDETQSHFDDEDEYQQERQPDETDVEREGEREKNDRLETETSGDESQTEAKVPRSMPSISPMQRLTDQVRGMESEKRVNKIGVLPSPSAEQFPEATSQGQETHAQASTALQDVETAETSQEETTDEEVPEPGVPASRSTAPQQLDLLHTNTPALRSDGSLPSKIDSPDTPVATTWARPSSLKHPRPQRQQAMLDFTPLEVQQIRAGSPSVATSHPSPLTPTFEPEPSSPEMVAPEGPWTGGAASPVNQSYVLESELPQPLKSHPPGVEAKRPKKAPPLMIDTTNKKPGRVTSMASITSAGEDVLAAWAELGGGSDALGFRRKRSR